MYSATRSCKGFPRRSLKNIPDTDTPASFRFKINEELTMLDSALCGLPILRGFKVERDQTNSSTTNNNNIESTIRIQWTHKVVDQERDLWRVHDRSQKETHWGMDQRSETWRRAVRANQHAFLLEDLKQGEEVMKKRRPIQLSKARLPKMKLRHRSRFHSHG